MKGISLELTDSNHNVNCEKSICDLFLDKKFLRLQHQLVSFKEIRQEGQQFLGNKSVKPLHDGVELVHLPSLHS